MDTTPEGIPPKETNFFKPLVDRLRDEAAKQLIDKPEAPPVPVHEAELEVRIANIIRRNPDWGDEQIADLFDARLSLVEKMRGQYLATLEP